MSIQYCESKLPKKNLSLTSNFCGTNITKMYLFWCFARSQGGKEIRRAIARVLESPPRMGLHGALPVLPTVPNSHLPNIISHQNQMFWTLKSTDRVLVHWAAAGERFLEARRRLHLEGLSSAALRREHGSVR